MFARALFHKCISWSLATVYMGFPFHCHRRVTTESTFHLAWLNLAHSLHEIYDNRLEPLLHCERRLPGHPANLCWRLVFGTLQLHHKSSSRIQTRSQTSPKVNRVGWKTGIECLSAHTASGMPAHQHQDPFWTGLKLNGNSIYADLLAV